MKVLSKLLALALVVAGLQALAQKEAPEPGTVAPTGGMWQIDTSELTIPYIHQEVDSAKRAATFEIDFYDVVIDPNYFKSFGPFDENGFMVPGANFIVSNAYIYPGGTLFTLGLSENNDWPWGILPDGSPEFPDLILGRFACWGTVFVNTFGVVTSYTTQVFDFHPVAENAGEETLVVTGMEPFSINPTTRSVTGGTGKYRRTGSEVVQFILAPTNVAGAPNLYFAFIPPYTVVQVKDGVQQ